MNKPKPLCPACTAILPQRNRKGGLTRSARKTATARANAKLPRKKALWPKAASASARAMVDATTRRAAKALLRAPAALLRPQIGQVWMLEGSSVEWMIEYVTDDNIISRYSAMSSYGPGGYDRAQFYDLAAWLAGRKAGTIKLVRECK